MTLDELIQTLTRGTDGNPGLRDSVKGVAAMAYKTAIKDGKSHDDAIKLTLEQVGSWFIPFLMF